MESEIQPGEGLGGKELLVKIVVTAIGRGGPLMGRQNGTGPHWVEMPCHRGSGQFQAWVETNTAFLNSERSRSTGISISAGMRIFVLGFSLFRNKIILSRSTSNRYCTTIVRRSSFASTARAAAGYVLREKSALHELSLSLGCSVWE